MADNFNRAGKTAINPAKISQRFSQMPQTIHHLGYGESMIAGDTIKLKSKMR